MSKFAFDPPHKTYGWDTMVGGPYEAQNSLDHSRQYMGDPADFQDSRRHPSNDTYIKPRLHKVHQPGHVREYGGEKDDHGHWLYETEARDEAHAMMKMIPVLKKRGHLD